MIERIHLQILSEVERQGSLTEAAKALHLTQSALSHSIKKLEASIGTPLWKKEGRKLRLTQAGMFTLKEAKRLLPQLNRLDEVLTQFAKGERGSLNIGMECYPCYQWLLTVMQEFLDQWPGVDVDVKQRFQFGGMAALFNYEIDILLSPDPIERKGCVFTPVFDYEQVLVVGSSHPLSDRTFITPQDLTPETLLTYPVETERLDIFKLFLLPANCLPKKHKTIEATEIILQLVAANRGVACLPLWLLERYSSEFPIAALKLGKKGIQKKIHFGMRSNERPGSFASALLALAQKRPG